LGFFGLFWAFSSEMSQNTQYCELNILGMKYAFSSEENCIWDGFSMPLQWYAQI
jgi:hypothetical protein